ncbi:MAG: metal-binding protein [Prochlorococcaceae cyanobacterium ETNP7_MAG_30]|nr:metal-binding protein [Prochlorococcaceae cyanobacterium ETNP18_MAG_17]MDP6321803.1 metal-binding protein [Prochlorococcaceae cyanobacterium ETNP14_MAG_5]MDP7327833.1 metal-binding protein [Prochlorococcaceae cyanobacterium ETNP7_MAG_30]
MVLTLYINRALNMSTRASCKTCDHCGEGQFEAGSWCRMRQITVHHELAQFALCHHWMEQAPSLPVLKEQATERKMDRQLELSRALVGSFSEEI